MQRWVGGWVLFFLLAALKTIQFGAAVPPYPAPVARGPGRKRKKKKYKQRTKKKTQILRGDKSGTETDVTSRRTMFADNAASDCRRNCLGCDTTANVGRQLQYWVRTRFARVARDFRADFRVFRAFNDAVRPAEYSKPPNNLSVHIRYWPLYANLPTNSTRSLISVHVRI